jgi:hypothetical protein
LYALCGKHKVKAVGSKTFDGVRFSAYPLDHLPRHVHGFYAGVEVIVELGNGVVRLAERPDAISPAGAKRSDVNHILRTARKNADGLVELWRSARG